MLGRRLDRYIVSETIGPLVLGFSVYTFILLIQLLFKIAEMVIRRGLSIADIGRLVLYSLPNIVVLTIPMALLFGILIAIGRLASDSELVAMRASGVSLYSIYRPILVLSLLLTAFNTYLMAGVLPDANHKLQLEQLQMLARTASRQVEPRVFYEQWEGYVLYVSEIDPAEQDVWKGVFLAPSIPFPQSTVTVAARGRLMVDAAGERIVLRLDEAVTHKVDLSRPGSYETIRHERMEVVLDDQFTSRQRAAVSASKGVRELDLGELEEKTRDRDEPVEIRRLARVEIHKKFSIPVACLVFGLFAVPLGFNNRRGGKSTGFALSILVIVCYYVIMYNGEEAARVGRIPPWLSMWLPNLLFAGLGTYLLVRRNLDKTLLVGPLRRGLDRLLRRPMSRGHQRVRARLQARQTERRLERERRAPDVVLRLPRFTLRFPNSLDRHVMRLFLRVFLLVAASGLALFIIVDLTDNLDDILDNRPPVSVIVDYYLYMSLQIFFEISPIFVLVATLLTFSVMARNNEVTACKALGISLYRLALPALVAASLVSFTDALLAVEVLPASNQKVAELKDRMKSAQPARTYRRADRQWVYGQGPYIFNYLFYDPGERMLQNLQVFHLGEDHQITHRLFAERAHYVEGRWVLEGGWARSFEGYLETSFRPFERPQLAPYRETPEYLGSEGKRPEQMHYRELAEYIDELERSGQRVPALRVELHNKVAFPAISFIMALVALPFAFRLGKRGALYGIGISLVLGMVFLGIFAFFSTLGEAGVLPPFAAVWGPSLLFGALSIYLFLGVRT